MVKLLFFGHDAHDAAVKRRIAAFGAAGADVTAFTMRRGPAFEPPWRNVDLGETRDAAFGQRIAALIGARPVLRRYRQEVLGADIVYARNLDMLALARWAMDMSGSRASLVYECLDVHRFLSREDAIGAGLRAMEARLLAHVALIVVSSPAFVREYFQRRHVHAPPTVLIENRLPAGFAYGARPEAAAPKSDTTLRVGWFGNLRCARSLALLLDLASRFPDRIELSLRGVPARAAVGDFEARVAGRENVQFGGRYSWPHDLAGIYREVDLVWAGDFHDANANSKWLLPNRLYEGGYYGAPALAPADSETGRWIDARGFGFTLAEPLEETLPGFVGALDYGRLAEVRARLLAAPASTFLQPEDELASVIEAAMAGRHP